MYLIMSPMVKVPVNFNTQSGIWQRGPDFLRLEESEWPISQIVSTLEIPAKIMSVMYNDGTEIDSLERRINVAKFSSYIRLIRVTCRILLMYNKAPKLSFSNVSNKLLKVNIEKAEIFWISDAQTELQDDVMKGRFCRLSAKKRDDGIIVVTE